MAKAPRVGAPRLQSFWSWYERHYSTNVALTAMLFALQLIHLYWLMTHVVAQRLFGESLFSPPPFWQYAIIVVDYTEIPALLSTTILYLFELQRMFSWKHTLFIVALNIQWLHLFWITDEFVVSRFAGAPGTTVLPVWLAWIAILIDYLELPVIFDTFRRLWRSIKEGDSFFGAGN